jgi:small-conductance mechanosensitive channel
MNFQSPSSEMSILVPIGVSYGSDLEKVEKVTNEVITEIHNEVDGAKKGHDPLIRYREFADSSINFIAILRVIDPAKQGIVKHEFIKRLKKRFDAEGIEIPFPIRTVVMDK